LLGLFEQTTLPNGTNLYIHSTGRFRTHTVRVYLRRPLQPGANTRTALIARLLNRGGLGPDSGRHVAQRLEELYGAELRAGVAKSGCLQIAYIHLSLAGDRYLPEPVRLLPPALAMLCSFLTTAPTAAGFTAPVVEQEASYLARDIRGLIDDRTRYSVLRCTEEMCRGTPAALTELGRLEDLGQVDPGQLADEYGDLIAGWPMEVFAVGSLNRSDRELLAETLSFPRRPRKVPRELELPPPGPEAREVVEGLDIAQSRLCLGIRCFVEPSHPDYYALLMYDGILGGFPHSKLFVNVREREGLAYDAWSFLAAVPGLQYIVAGTAPEQRRRALEVINEQRCRIAEGDISDYELQATRDALIRRTRLVLDHPARMMGAAMFGLLTGRDDSPEEQEAALNQIGVADIVRVAQRVRLDTVFALVPKGGTAHA
jgi:predicted Zn-dependent peptidase